MHSRPKKSIPVKWEQTRFPVTVALRVFCKRRTSADSQHPSDALPGTFCSTNTQNGAYTFTICHTAGYSSAKTTRMTSSL